MTDLLAARALSKTYGGGTLPTAQPVRALQDVSFTSAKGEWLGIKGPSGSGKSTLLNLIGCVDVPTSGELWFDGDNITAADEGRRQRLRRTRIGYLFQYFNLLPTLTALENVMLSLLLQGFDATRAARSASSALERVGLAERLTHFPAELSGGEMQRVAFCRATVHEPALLIADEPTGNLDRAAGETVLALMKDRVAGGTTVIMASHSERALSFCSRVIEIVDGRISALAGSPL